MESIRRLERTKELIREIRKYGVPQQLLQQLTRLVYDAGYDTGGNESHAMTIAVLSVLLENGILTDEMIEDPTFQNAVEEATSRIDALVEELPAGTSINELPDMHVGKLFTRMRSDGDGDVN